MHLTRKHIGLNFMRFSAAPSSIRRAGDLYVIKGNGGIRPVIMINNQTDHIYDKLYSVYRKYQLKYNGSINSRQMCLMWSTHRLPDVLTETKQLSDIEKMFEIDLNEDEAIELYDMTLDEAVEFIKKRVNQK